MQYQNEEQNPQTIGDCQNGRKTMPSSLSMPTLRDAYTKFAPIFYSALGRLARGGFPVPPADAPDLIHDFFLQAWPGIEKRYRPERGALEVYVYGAFVQFARPRIVRLVRVQSHVSDRVLLEGLACKAPEPEGEIDLKALSPMLEEGIQALSVELRECLVLYCFEGRSERDLARERKVSRYSLRERLIEALGRVVVRFPSPKSFGSTEWAVARAVWYEERTIKGASLVLGITQHQASQAYKNCVRALSRVLKNLDKSKGTKKMNEEPGVLTILRDALLSGGNQAALETVRLRAREILESLDATDGSEILPEAEMRAVDGEWLGRVYEALGTGAMELVPPTEASSLEKLFAAQAEDARSVGRAFEGALYPSLPPEFRQFEEAFLELQPLPPEAYEEVLSRLDVQGFPHAEAIAKFGITPLIILRATDSVAMLTERIIDRDFLKEDQPILLSVGDAEQKPGYQHLSYGMVADEVHRATRSSPVFAKSLLRWCVGVAQYVPLLFDEFEATSQNRFGIELRYTGRSEKDLYRRWAREVVPPSEHASEVPSSQPTVMET